MEVLTLHLLLSKIIAVHLSQFPRKITLASHLSLNIVVVVLHRRLQQLIPFHFLHAAHLVLPVLLILEIVDLFRFFLHAFEQLLVLCVGLVAGGLGNQVLHLLVLERFLSLLLEDFGVFDFDLLVQVGFLDVSFALLLGGLIELDLDIQ